MSAARLAMLKLHTHVHLRRGTLALALIASAAWPNLAWPLEEYRLYRFQDGTPLALKEEKELAAHPGTSFRECPAGCPEMVVIPAGHFMMGSPKSEEDRDDDEGPRHKVSIAKPIAVSKYPVTFAEWDTCTNSSACSEADDYGWGRGNRPVIYATWYDAKKYVTWLSNLTGKSYRLLSEAEWEYAARGGTTTAYFFKDEKGSCHACNYSPVINKTAPVGSFKPNAFGLHDMVGNVWQWVEDCYIGSYVGAPSNGSARTNRNCSSRVIRGGSWLSGMSHLRTAHRSSLAPDVSGNKFGFRVARPFNP